MIGYLDDEDHERLWRICDTLVSGAGARAAILCDESNGAIVLSVGDASASGAVSQVEKLSPGEFALDGEAGQFYGVNIPGGAILLVLHDAGLLEQIRGVAAEAVHDLAETLAGLPPPLPEVPLHAHLPVNETSASPVTKSARPKAAPVARKKPRPKKNTAGKQAPRKGARPARRRPAKTKPAPGAKPKARMKSKPKRRR